VDPASGKRRVEACLDDWLAIRADTVAKKTAVVDRALKRLTPIWFLNMGVRHIGEREVARVLEDLVRQGLAEGSVKRYRASLSSFFGWCVREKYFLVNPVSSTRAPRSSDEPTEMLPFAEEELEMVWERWAARNRRLADIMLLLGWTGLRWAEARAVRVGDVMKVPTPGLVISRSNPEGVGLKSRLMGSSMRMNSLLVFVSLLGGIMGFGARGLIYGPLIMTLFLALVQLYQTRYQQHIARRLGAAMPGLDKTNR